MCMTDTPIKIFEKLQMDIVGPFPRTISENSFMLTWQDCHSKYSGSIPLAKTEAPKLAVAFVESFVCKFGCPEIIKTDQGGNSMIKIMEGFAEIF